MPAEIINLLKHEVHYAALAIMGIVYVAKILWILRFKPIVERTPSKGNESKAIRASFFCIATPWGMESTRKNWHKWLEFAIFHIGIALAIGLSFMISLNAESIYLNGTFITLAQIIFILSFITTIIRTWRRLFSPVNRAISHPDDYFSIILMLVWFLFASWYVITPADSLILGLYLGLTALLIGYVPFSKMSHYIMWPFMRYYFGKHFGHRGVYPKIKND